jgi:hypothetical protein
MLLLFCCILHQFSQVSIKSKNSDEIKARQRHHQRDVANIAHPH